MAGSRGVVTGEASADALSKELRLASLSADDEADAASPVSSRDLSEELLSKDRPKLPASRSVCAP